MAGKGKSKVLSVRVPADTAERWREKAEASGMTLSDWVRGQIDDKEIRGFRPRRPKPAVPARQAPKADPKLIQQLAWIGNNLNQIARKINMDGVEERDELLEALLEIEMHLWELKNNAY